MTPGFIGGLLAAVLACEERLANDDLTMELAYRCQLLENTLAAQVADGEEEAYRTWRAVNDPIFLKHFDFDLHKEMIGVEE